MAQRRAVITVRNTSQVGAYINLGFGLASNTFDPSRGFPRPPYLGDIVDFGGFPADVRNINLGAGQSYNVTVTFYDDRLVGQYNSAYFLVVVWDASTGFQKVLAYKFQGFTVTAPSQPAPSPTPTPTFEITVTIS